MVTSDSISEILGSFKMWSWRRMEIIWTNHMRNKEALQGTKKERNILRSIKRKTTWMVTS
jgi:hypothetical protein